MAESFTIADFGFRGIISSSPGLGKSKYIKDMKGISPDIIVIEDLEAHLNNRMVGSVLNWLDGVHIKPSTEAMDTFLGIPS